MNKKLIPKKWHTSILLTLLVVNLIVSLGLLSAGGYWGGGQKGKLWAASKDSSGELRVRDKDGKVLGACPLQHTDVDADISGFVSRVRVRQTFANPLNRKIEAIYVFPLPEHAAVDDMTMTIGNRRIVGRVKPKPEARQIYEQAKASGRVASLLDQERPNIFTQSVANIEPGAQVVIEISYVETLKYEDGVFEFVYPMVVGPRFMPGADMGSRGTGTAPDTDRVPDASKISPPIAPEDTRAGHDINVTVHLDGGAELFDVKSELHQINIQQTDRQRALISLKPDDRIPNKDFILRYRTATDEIEDEVFMHPFDGGAFFTLILQPPRRVPAEQARPKEMIFVIDRSGSQSGFPIEKAKDTMRACIEGMNPNDTFNLIDFSTETNFLFPQSMPNTDENRAKALERLKWIDATGGTVMLPAVQAALSGRPDPKRVRIVCFMTDGYIGNDFELIDAVKKNAGTSRVFSFGIGNSVNRFLLDGMAHAGRGEVEYVTLAKDADAAAKRFHERTQSPVLTDIELDWEGVKPEEIYPRRLPDLFSEKPVIVHGVLRGKLDGVVTLSGNTSQGHFERRIVIHPPDKPEPHSALASLWARAKVQDLMMLDMAGLQSGNMRKDLQQAITDLGVRYRLMTQFTSFVAVDEMRRTKPGASDRVAVPVEKGDGLAASMGGMMATPNARTDRSRGVASAYRATYSNPPLMAQARSGDPLLRVKAPDDAEQVIALLPGGEIKRLLWEKDKAEWLARFDIPTYAPEGDYFVRVLIVLKDSTRQTVLLRYKVDMTPPIGSARTRIAPIATGVVNLELDAGEDTARVAALLPWGERIELTPSQTESHRFAAQITVPTAHRGKPSVVTFVLTDRAHNRTQITMDMSK